MVHKGIRMREDISLVGADDFPESSHSVLPLELVMHETIRRLR